MNVLLLRYSSVLAVFVSIAIARCFNLQAQLRESDRPPVKASGIDKRVPWTTSRLVGSPDPPLPYQIKRVFPKLKFTEPVDFCAAPGSDRLFVLEQKGKVYSFPSRDNNEQPELVIDLQSLGQVSAAYGITFHPGFETNRYAYICYVTKDGLADGTRVSRFVVSKSDPPKIDPSSEKIVITWLSGGHNGGCLKFGPDGFLYISTGDAASPNPPDPLDTGQDNKDLLSAILRIDVDQSQNSNQYRVPADNPFVNMTGLRPEVWAYGFRNPWRIGFDKRTGALWTGDVGWELWELVYRVERGGNYGWSVVEGRQSIRPNAKRGPTPILPPTVDHPHSEAASITGGGVYYGNRLKDLTGAYVYGDWVSGKIWALRHDGSKVTFHRHIANSALQIVCFGEDQSGELYIVDYAGGLYQLEPTTSPYDPAKFPRKLSETGLFDSTRDQKPAPGVLPFAINAEMWADGARAERFVALPGTSLIQTGATNVWLYQSKNEWRYPTNAVLAKTIFLPTGDTANARERRIETQVLHYDGRDWHAYTYRWNDAQTDASLVPDEGDEATFEISDPSVPEGRSQHAWRFHSRAECLRCHNPWINYALAFTAPQLNRELEYQSSQPLLSRPDLSSNPKTTESPRVVSNQLRTLSHIGFFDQPLDERARPKLQNPYANESANDLTERARSWLHVNCAHCHREGAGGAVVTHFDYDTKLQDAKAIGFPPSQGAFGMIGSSIVTPGDPFSSVLYYRISKLGQGRMPHIGSTRVDIAGVKLIADWIKQMPRGVNGSSQDANLQSMQRDFETKLRAFRSANSDPASQPSNATVDRLLGNVTCALTVLQELEANDFPNHLRRAVIERGISSTNLFVRDLFERFIPEEKRTKKLGPNIRPEMILALKGDLSRGKRLFFQEGGVQCYQCHRLQNEGREFGPDLSQIGKKYGRAQLLEQILAPSKIIDSAFVVYQLESRDEIAHSGFLVKKTPEEVVLKDATLKEIHMAARDVKVFQASPVSAMPEGLLQNLTAQEAADLLEFLAELQ